MTMGKFITIEGIEGAGKTTALHYVHQYVGRSQSVLMTREPGGTPLAELVRKLLLNTEATEKILAETELLLFFAGRNQHLQHLVLPALHAGKWVICDRFIDATYAYQGGGRGLSNDSISMLDHWIIKDLSPDLTILLDVSVEEGLLRAAKRGGIKDRIEKEKIEFFERVRERYLQRAAAYPQRIKVVDASQQLDLVQFDLKHILMQFLNNQVY